MNVNLGASNVSFGLPERYTINQAFLGLAIGLSLYIASFIAEIVRSGIQSVDKGQIEAARVAMTREMKRGGKIWIRIFPDKPITKKPAETRMGKGKGNPEGWVAVVKPGRILFEIEGVTDEIARKALNLAAAKLGVKTRIVTREDG